MPRNSLPPTFAKHRFKCSPQPGAVFHYKSSDDLPTYDEIVERIGGEDKNIPVQYFDNWWIEFKGGLVGSIGVWIVSQSDGPVTLDNLQNRITIFEGKAKVDSFVAGTRDVPDHENYDVKQLRVGVMTLIMRAAHDIYMRSEQPAEVSVNTRTRNAPAAFSRAEGTVRYAKLSDLSSASGQGRQRDYTPPEEPSGIRKCEHVVRGHWRTYSSGVKVWVKSHTRGDPELGSTTRIYQ